MTAKFSRTRDDMKDAQIRLFPVRLMGENRRRTADIHKFREYVKKWPPNFCSEHFSVLWDHQNRFERTTKEKTSLPSWQQQALQGIRPDFDDINPNPHAKRRKKTASIPDDTERRLEHFCLKDAAFAHCRQIHSRHLDALFQILGRLHVNCLIVDSFSTRSCVVPLTISTHSFKVQTLSRKSFQLLFHTGQFDHSDANRRRETAQTFAVNISLDVYSKHLHRHLVIRVNNKISQQTLCSWHFHNSFRQPVLHFSSVTELTTLMSVSNSFQLTRGQTVPESEVLTHQRRVPGLSRQSHRKLEKIHSHLRPFLIDDFSMHSCLDNNLDLLNSFFEFLRRDTLMNCSSMCPEVSSWDLI